MKNTFKLFGMLLLAGTIMLAGCNKETADTINNVINEATTYTVKVNCNDATMGTVKITPDSTVYHKGTEVTITAIANQGFKFVGWTGAETVETETYTFHVEGNATYTANFEALPQVMYNATFDGSTLDIAGWNDFQTNGELWLLQFAQAAEGTVVSFPYLVMWMQGTNTDNFSVYQNGAIELYKDTYYEDNQGNKYGDWQFYETETMNCTNLDLTNLMLSFTGSFTMYDLGNIVDETAEDPADCTHKTLNVTVSNATFEMATKGAFHKMNVK